MRSLIPGASTSSLTSQPQTPCPRTHRTAPLASICPAIITQPLLQSTPACHYTVPCRHPMQHSTPRFLLPPAAAAPASSSATLQQGEQGQPQHPRSRICTSVTAASVEAFIAEIQEAASRGVDIIEMRLDYLKVCVMCVCVCV
jgi:hypothetical protein